jgi:hypothetical protein
MQTARSYPRAKAVTTGAQTPPLRRIMASTAGTVQFTTSGGDSITLPMVAGQQLDVEVKSVQSVGAGSFFGVWG